MQRHVKSDEQTNFPFISTGRLPTPEMVQSLVAEAHVRFKSNAEGRNSQVYPALARVPRDLFGVCVVGTSGSVYAAGDTEHPFSIMSVSKPFVFALVCQEIGAEQAREKLGANATGLPFNSLYAVERSADRRTNPMVNAGAIATTALAVMTTAGLYETSGDWLFDIGLPGKSGIGGGIVTVSPGKGGLGTFAPPLDSAATA